MAWLWAILFCAGIVSVTLRQGGDVAMAAMLSGGKEAVTLCLELAGAYLLFMGLMGVAKKAGLMQILSRRLSGVTRWLFPRAGGATGAIALTLAANMLGLGNAATPLGLSAMHELQADNPDKALATDTMCAFLIINASCLQILPTSIIALRQAAGSASPASIVLPSLAASTVSTIVAVVLCRMLRRA